MSPDLLVQLCGLHSFAFALFHLAFWKLFHWKHELQKVGLPTRAITQILNLRLIYLFAGVGVLCFAFTQELHSTALGRTLLVFMSLSGSAELSSSSYSCASTSQWCMC